MMRTRGRRFGFPKWESVKEELGKKKEEFPRRPCDCGREGIHSAFSSGYDSVEEQQHNRTQNGGEEACGFAGEIPAHLLAEVRSNERAGDAE
jgi:hypothetical protein